MISRRALFGLGAGAAAAAVVPTPVQCEPIVVGMDFGTTPSATIFQKWPDRGRTLKWLASRPSYFSKFEVDIRFEDPLPDGWLK